MKTSRFLYSILVVLAAGALGVVAQSPRPVSAVPTAPATPAAPVLQVPQPRVAVPPVAVAPAAAPAALPQTSQTYVLSPNDVILVKVYQEDDLETRMRIAKDGTSSFPLIGVLQLGGKTLNQAAGLIRDALGRDYLVNPQVTLTVVEYAKRRFTVLGQVQRPGTYEIPNEESVTLLQAVAMAGGYTRLANRGGVSVTRIAGGKRTTYILDGKSSANDVDNKSFEVLAEDTITISERLF
ncbi:MAG: polysaccharide biosynthesis/export protein VpsN [Verrucomicrobiota bacterium]|jgi:polysaccharide export outer membrane protein